MPAAAAPLPLVYACAGCSSAAQLANHGALQLDRRADLKQAVQPASIDKLLARAS